jgi:hypothetical protein
MKKRIARIGAALLAVLAMAGIAASAAVAHEWSIGGSTLTKLGLPSEALTIPSGIELHFASTIGGQEFKWVCGGVGKTSEAAIKQGGKGRFNIAFNGCVFEDKHECPMAPLASIPLSGELIEVGGVLYEKFSAESGENLFGFKFGSGTMCTQIEGKWWIQGSVAARVSNAKLSTVEHSLEFSNAINVAAGAKVHFGTNPASFTGSFSQALAGGNSGKTWAAE